MRRYVKDSTTETADDQIFYPSNIGSDMAVDDTIESVSNMWEIESSEEEVSLSSTNKNYRQA